MNEIIASETAIVVAMIAYPIDLVLLIFEESVKWFLRWCIPTENQNKVRF